MFLLSMIGFETNGQTKYLNPELKPGPYKVGFKVFHEYDYSRTLPSEILPFTNSHATNLAKPIQITVWYPAETGPNDKPMPFKSYIELMATECEYDYKGALIDHPLIQFMFKNSFFKMDQIDAALNASSNVIKDAKGKSGSFPVLIYAPGSFGPNFENSTLFEYLASYGFIIASFPASHVDWEGDWYVSAPRDLEFVIGFMHSYPCADMQKIGLMAFSAGGYPMMKVAASNIMVKALVSFDGYIPFPKDEGGNPAIKLKRVSAPVLFFRSGPDTARFMPYDSLNRQDAYDIRFKKFGHVFFGSAWDLLTDHASSDWAAVKGTQDETNLGYKLLSEYVLCFYKAYLQDDSDSKNRLKTLHLSKEIPDQFMTFEYKWKNQ